MDRTTDDAVASALRAVRDRAEAERLARRAFHRAEGRRQIVTAAGIDVDDLSEHGRRILDWLADWDEPTVEGVVELVAATRAAAAGGTGDRP
jgi:regulator of protease activity HflC (stomatin/prohibitin superfamily)